jgi:hypothetical protein
MARAGRELAFVALERLRVDLPVEPFVRTPREDARFVAGAGVSVTHGDEPSLTA